MRCNSFGTSDVALLTVLVAAAEQHDNGIAPAHKVQPITRPVVDTHFVYSVTHRPTISKIAISDIPQAGLDADESAPVPQFLNPPRESGAFDDPESKRGE